MKEIQYFVLWLQENDEPCGIYDEDICIKAIREPTLEEANEFAMGDRLRYANHPLKVVRIERITEEEAHEQFVLRQDMPVFGDDGFHTVVYNARTGEDDIVYPNTHNIRLLSQGFVITSEDGVHEYPWGNGYKFITSRVRI